jgi:hypothetical protein
LFDGCLVAGLIFLEHPGDFGKGAMVRVVARASRLPQGSRSPTVRGSVPRLRHFDFSKSLKWRAFLTEIPQEERKIFLAMCESEADATTRALLASVLAKLCG